MFTILVTFIIVIATAAALGASVPVNLLPQLDGRIVGGSNAEIASFPWQVSLQRFGSHSCGGSIYSSNIVVTAAHCLKGVSASILQVRVGSTYWSSGGRIVSVAAIKIHERYNQKTMANDIGIVRLSSSLSFSNTVKPIPVASKSPLNGAPAIVSGWGTRQYGSSVIPSTLQSVDLQIVSQRQCASSNYGYGNEVRQTMLCAAATGRDACQGDSGGPLVSNGKLVGIVSWGYGCAHPNYPGVYADAALLQSWISKAAGSI